MKAAQIDYKKTASL